MKRLGLVVTVLLACSLSLSATGVVTVTSPLNNSTVTSPVLVHATYSATATYMKLWVDHVAVIALHTGSVFDYSAALAPGAHLLEVQAADATSGVVVTTRVNITVSSGSTQSVTVTTPLNNSTVTSPVAIHATYSRTANYMKLWIDHVASTVEHNGSVFDTTSPLTAGPHLLEVQAQDSTTLTTFTTPVNITVTNATGVSVSPSLASVVAGQSQQFTATGATGAVTWSVSPAAAGSITSSGLFTAGATAGTATIAAADSGTGKSGTATANVIAFVITPNPASVTSGGTVTLTANAPATWSVTSGGGTISNTTTASTTATYTALSVAGSATVTANESANNAIAASATVNTAALTITPGVAHTGEGQSQQFTANAPVTWTTSCGSIDANGLFTAPSVVGDCTITATQTTASATATAVDHVTVPIIQGLHYTTWKNDLARTGQQRSEILLTPANVNATTFGLKFSAALDGMVFAQPLYMSALTINGAKHNVVFVATEHDTLYAFDSDTAGAPLWKKTFLINGATTVPQANVGSTIPTEIGITGTPVIDPATGTLYLVAETLEAGVYKHRLHALDVTTGNERTGSPKLIAPTGFASKEELQRTGLALANGNVYVAFGSQGDHAPYNGWVVAYSATTLAQVAAWNVSPGGTAGGVWESGSAPSIDSNGDLYVSTGNGSFNKTTQFSMSIVKLSPTLSVLDWFAPFDAVSQSKGDKDVGSGGVLVVPDQSGPFPHELIECGKLPQVYVLNRDNLGHQGATSNSQIVQELTNVVGGNTGTQSADHCFTTPAYWEGNVYFAGNNDVIRRFILDPSTGKLSTAALDKGTFIFAFPGGQPVTSSNSASSGIVWVVDRGAPAHLHAFDAANVSNSLYTSGPLVFEKFAVPTVVEGKVFVAGQGKLFVFGLF
ncbi:MAG TPA: hypothetical protein VM578_11955 [Candidatus Saccharimonadales bacterium]|nr:hypothetical protein [Candidatus Saccharimonadales bacterium]